jgi:hypothetical protein
MTAGHVIVRRILSEILVGTDLLSQGKHDHQIRSSRHFLPDRLLSSVSRPPSSPMLGLAGLHPGRASAHCA